jgi:hexosaminidase
MSAEESPSRKINLLPQPRKLVRTSGTLRPAGAEPKIVIDASMPHPQGYRLSITAAGIGITAAGPAGVLNGRRTLAQLRSQFPSQLPCLEIEDWPDFPVRGVMLDISRDKVPTIHTLFQLIDLLASWKINQVQLYTEHTFAYSKHRTVWENASPLDAGEIQQLDRYCRERGIDMVPNQNSLGHMERWLNHPEYQHLAEAVDGADTGWGYRWKGPFSICPTDPASLEFLRGLYDELLPNFSSALFNIGLDETFDIGQGRSRAEADRIGKHRVYLDFLARVNELVKSHDRRMMFWGDVILHQPELIAELPKDVIALQWGYEDSHSFHEQSEKFAAAGVPFYVCPGTSSWNSIAGRTQNALANLRVAAEAGLRHGAIGYLNTDWGDNGHLQYLPVSYLGFAAGAAFSWCLEASTNVDLTSALNKHAFHDETETLGRVAIDLGNVYQSCGKLSSNGSALFRLLVIPPVDPSPEKGMTPAGLDAADAAIDRAIAPLNSFRAPTEELQLTADEFRNAAAMLHYCVAIGRVKIGASETVAANVEAIMTEHRRLWLARNRPGGLADSLRRLKLP